MGIIIIKLVIAIVVCQLAGLIGSIFTRKSIPTWYAKLRKPGFNPPNWLFAPVWTILYLLMGISLYLVWTSGADMTLALIIFSIQLILNIAWSIVFFGLRRPLSGFLAIIALWLSIILTMLVFFHVSKTASLILIPYILWVSFASVLNYYLWKLNTSKLNASKLNRSKVKKNHR